jgi:hypothetical protein
MQAMITIEERVRQGIERSRGDNEALVEWIVREIGFVRSAMPSPDYLDSIASMLEMTGFGPIDLPDGTSFDASNFLRHTAVQVRLVIKEEAEPD